MKKTNNKGFSLIELIIVIAIMAVLVAIIAPNLTKYLGSSKEKTDQKNADELASQIQTCITEFDTANAVCLGTTNTINISWSGATATVSGSSNDSAFEAMLNQNITTAVESKETGASGTAEINYDETSKVYSITVKLGKVTATK